jgi:hypothetical protein
MSSGQRQSRRTVVERCRMPARLRMACQTLRREISCHVIGIRRRSEVGEMASDARGGKPAVLIIDMASRAGNRQVRASEGKLRPVMIEPCPLPRRGVVTHLALGRKTRACMIRIGRRRVFRSMAHDALRRR